MSIAKKLFAGCILIPILLFASCAGKIYLDNRMYELPGEILKSPESPTHSLTSSLQIAEALDTYVQPRFEILRDKNFGAMRIVYRKHAGIVQLKVDTPQEKELIANVNAAKRDYAISLLHCAPAPGYEDSKPRLELLYFNQEKIVSDGDHFSHESSKRVANKNGFDFEEAEKKAIAVLPKLMEGKQQHIEDASWDILMRPVLASNQDCLSCHKNAKPGATLGVMLYAVRKTKNDDPKKIGLR